MFTKPTFLRVATVILLLSGIVSPTPSVADENSPAKGLSMVLLGDSYSAGNGAGFYDSSPAGAYRSSQNWAHGYRKWLVEQGVAARLVNLAHSGHTTEQLLKEQVQSIPNDVDVVMLTIGGNDINFEKVVEKCFALHYRHPLECKEVVEGARSAIRDPGPEGIAARTIKVLDAINAKVVSMGRKGVQIILVSYPNLLLPDSDEKYILHECLKWEGLSCLEYGEYAAGTAILEAGKEMANAQHEAVSKWNWLVNSVPGNSAKARYIDSIPERFLWHEPNPSVLVKNSKRWINEFFETMGVKSRFDETVTIPSFDKMEWYHPNRTGHKEIGKALSEDVGIPRVRRQELPPNSSDAEPDARERKSMLAWVQGPYAHPIGETLLLDATGSYSANGSIIKYEWDLDGDKKFDRTTKGPYVTHVWGEEFVGNITLRITTDTGATATGTTEAMITNDGDSTPYAKDNCPEVNNHGQTDYDGDGIGDECDPTPGYPTEDRPGVSEGPAPAPDPVPSPSPTPSPPPTTSPSASPTSRPSPTPSQTPSVAPSPSLSPSATASPEPSVSPSASPSVSPSVEPSVTVAPTVSPSESVSPLPSVTPSTSPTGPAPSATAAPTVTGPPTFSPEPTGTPVPTVSPTSNPPVPPSPTSAPAPTTPQPTTPELPGVPVPSRPASPGPDRPRPGLPNTGA